MIWTYVVVVLLYIMFDGVFCKIIIILFICYSRKKDPRTPVKGIGVRLKNIGKNNFRGIIGSILPLCVLSWQSEKDNVSEHLCFDIVNLAWNYTILEILYEKGTV